MNLQNLYDEKLYEICPEKRLLVAIICRAFLDINSAHYNEKMSALDWLLDDDCKPLISFDFVCEQLEINKELVRRIFLEKGIDIKVNKENGRVLRVF